MSSLMSIMMSVESDKMMLIHVMYAVQIVCKQELTVLVLGFVVESDVGI